MSASGPKFLAFCERALGALLYVVNFTSLDTKPARPELREIFNVTFQGGRVLVGRNFLLFMEECTVLYLMVALSADRSQACSARSPRNFQFHFSVGESSYGPNFLVFSEIALGALPYVFNVTSLDAKSARPDLRENFNLTFQGGRVRVVPIFLNVIKERMVFYLIVFNFSSLGPKTSRQLSE